MSDIYHAITHHSYHLNGMDEGTLREHRDYLDDAELSITTALKLIGDLVMETTFSDSYSDQESRRDLNSIGSVLRNLPRLAQALRFNATEIDFELKRRKETAQ